MSKNALYLAAYDIGDARRLRLALNLVKDYASGGQKSVFECFLSEAERRDLISAVSEVIHQQEDRFFLLHLDPRMKTRTHGIAAAPADPDFFFIG